MHRPVAQDHHFSFFCKGNPFFGLFSQSVGIVIDRAPPDFKKSLSSASGSGSLTSIVTVIYLETVPELPSPPPSPSCPLTKESIFPTSWPTSEKGDVPWRQTNKRTKAPPSQNKQSDSGGGCRVLCSTQLHTLMALFTLLKWGCLSLCCWSDLKKVITIISGLTRDVRRNQRITLAIIDDGDDDDDYTVTEWAAQTQHGPL